MIELVEAAPHVRMLRGKTLVLKVGGSCLRGPGLEGLVQQIALVQELGARVVVVHGAGPQTDALQRSLGEEPHKVGGRRLTSPLALRALRFASMGELNGDLCAALGSCGARAVGVGGSSAGILEARRRPPRTVDGDRVDFGEVGDLVRVRPQALRDLLDAGWIPVLGPPAGDGQGGFLNVNADLAAAQVAVALGAAKLVLLLDLPGLLRDPDDPHSLLSSLELEQLLALEEEGALRAGMAVKARAIEAALRGGVPRVHLVSGRDGEALLSELYTNAGSGTLVTVGREEWEEVPA